MERFDAKDLARAVDAGVLQPGQDRALLDFLRQQPQSRGSFQLAHVAFYFGALLIMGAMGWLLTEAWMRIGDTALLAIALLYIATLTLFALSLQRRGQPIAAGVLAAVAVSIVPLTVFAVERLVGWWPLDDAQGDYHQYYTYVQGGWLAMEAATVVAGLLMLRLVPFPFIVMPIALALWLLRRPVFMVFGAMGVAAYLGYLSYEVFADSLLFPLVVTLIGLGVIGLGLLYQKRREALSTQLRARLPERLLRLLPALRR
ncbi:DUF2157 domain-containing protein [Pseudomonas sichuanensis]|uniref:DUF2157 domain-containing protein n=1 Tax=Pseudomonas sichuanensis TaxID=2213015 RepID=UPI002446A28F|nr:DUF2157 domain-containing protein [Pseudomonas sichuanensis]MDH0730319.1 DUF2157 domain-containing protein [Pseudomonas sichuanensis]MDH1582295.1 DUF2157 domain-containing protein [Pseudomonas sichuanensis]MDH1591692.1 DUF2157 domain-containing protein [Pseudomonas sichuanensis]MDH1599489.1 DUF2157 domain-containing protein [Pseudomonas sichuanensis]